MTNVFKSLLAMSNSLFILTLVSSDGNKGCRIFSKSSYDHIDAMPLLPFVYPFKIKKKQCDKPNPLIVGGQNASYGEFPHMVAIGYTLNKRVSWICGGSIISEQYVLTAAHCTKTNWGTPDLVRIGAINIESGPFMDIDVEEAIVHPNYKPPVLYNDIALLKLKSNAYFSYYIRPACLSVINDLSKLPESIVVATGWGHISHAGVSSPNLLKVTLEIVTNENCKKHFHLENHLPYGIGESFFCAIGYLDSTHDTCQGDSGGPLHTFTKDDECTKEIIGITSFGKYCASGSPAIYVKIAYYVPWIETIINRNTD